jgi:hypothetical protein
MAVMEKRAMVSVWRARTPREFSSAKTDSPVD